MAADTQQYGVNPGDGRPEMMPQVDPGSPPADPMLAGPGAEDTAMEDAAEHQTRERVELGLLLTIEQLSKAGRVGEGAANMEYVSKAGMAAQAYALAYNYLATIEQKEEASGQQPSDPSQMQFGGQQPVSSPPQGMGA